MTALAQCMLIKMNRSIDVINIPHKNLPTQLVIKPDLSPKDHHLDSILIKERWSLIQSGQNKKIQSTKLYLKGNLYVSIIDSKFVSSSRLENSWAVNYESSSLPSEHGQHTASNA